MIVVVDYMMGNLRSVLKACLLTKKSVVISSDRKKIESAQKIVLPGVGAFSDAINELKRLKILDVLKNRINKGIPFLGVCLGMQLLFSQSEESPGSDGLDIIPGKVIRFSRKLKVPQIGWNQIKIEDKDCPLFIGIKNNQFAYFCHSYYCLPEDKSIVAGITYYGKRYASVIWRDNIFGVQFHPEKSQAAGLKILENFLSL
ncbi:MAG: imidazole glycerol phosphate synthase subunit HisH [Candidatus Omnitrophota bacterium]